MSNSIKSCEYYVEINMDFISYVYTYILCTASNFNMLNTI